MGGALRDKRGSGGDSQGPMALERVRAGPAVPRRRGEKPGGGVGGALRDKRGSGGDSQGPMALERVRAGPAVPRRRGEKPGGGVGGALRDKRDCDHNPHFRASGKGMLAREKARRAQTFLNANPDAPFEASLP